MYLTRRRRNDFLGFIPTNKEKEKLEKILLKRKTAKKSPSNLKKKRVVPLMISTNNVRDT